MRHGRAYGGRHADNVYDPVEQGWADIDFTYRLHIVSANNANGDPGDDLYVIESDAQNSGALSLDGWGGDPVFNIQDKSNGLVSFIFDNDTDHKNNAAFAANPMVWSGSGWLMGAGSVTRDWTFWAEQLKVVPIEAKSWTEIRHLYSR